MNLEEFEDAVRLEFGTEDVSQLDSLGMINLILFIEEAAASAASPDLAFPLASSIGDAFDYYQTCFTYPTVKQGTT